MADPTSISETVKSMQKEASLTLGWPVVVNYAVDKINRLLEVTFGDASREQVKELEFDIACWDDEEDKEYAIHYVLSLGAPLIQFNPRSAQGPTCNLAFRIVDGTAGRVRSSKPRKDVPSNDYTLVLSYLKLAAAKGHWDSNTKRHGEPFVFNDGAEQGCVVIDLPTSNDLTVQIHKSQNAPKFPIIDNHLGDMKESIKNLFVDGGVYKDVRYEIARVIPKAADGEYRLQPQSFLFDAFLRSDTPKPDDPGVFTLFIQTKGAEEGKRDELFTAWESQWRVSLKCSPIPEGKTASIIFSKEMIYKNAIQPALEAKSFEEKRIDGGNTIKMEINPNIHVHRNEYYEKIDVKRRGRGSIDLDLPPFQLELTERDSSGGSVISWRFDYKYTWSTFFLGPRSRPGNSGSVTVTNEVTGKYHKGSMDDRNVFVGCAVSPQDWQVTAHPDDQRLWEKLLGGTTSLPSWAKVEVNLPSFQFTLANVNFFLTTNLLFPGDKQVISVDKDSGLHIPSDFYLVGDVVDK